MTHPCAGHACDHCYTCDVLGICCATVPQNTGARCPAHAACQHDDALHVAVVEAAAAHVGLPDLIRVDQVAALETTTSLVASRAISPGSDVRAELLRASTPGIEVQEVVRVLAPGSHQQG